MTHHPFFSVVIPTYNRGALILKTLNTVLSQTYPHYEIIVIDDCSTDDTAEILEPLIKAEKLRYLRHDRNYERSHARNTGMENARGEFLTFLDSDDLMYPTNLEDAAQYIKANPETKFFHNLRQLVDAEGKLLVRYNAPSLGDPLQAITNGNFLGCVGVFIHREIYEAYRFDSNLTLAEDWDLWLRMMADYSPGRIDKFNSGVVHHLKRSINSTEFENMRKQYAYLISKIANDPHLNSVYGKHLKRLEASSLLYTSTVANLRCDHGEALKYLLHAAALDFRIVGSVAFMKAFAIGLLRWDKGY
jgi:glycosyltransferase involved in cell wall biosynthesis